MVVTPSRLRCAIMAGALSAAVAAAQARGDVVALLGQPLDVGLVDDGVLPGHDRAAPARQR